MEITLKFFASAADAVGERETKLCIDEGSTVDAMMAVLSRDYPKFAKMRPSVRVAVNHEYVKEDEVLAQGDEVAIIPPVSGGAS